MSTALQPSSVLDLEESTSLGYLARIRGLKFQGKVRHKIVLVHFKNLWTAVLYCPVVFSYKGSYWSQALFRPDVAYFGDSYRTRSVAKCPAAGKVLNGLNARQSEIYTEFSLKDSFKLLDRIWRFFRNVAIPKIMLVCKMTKKPSLSMLEIRHVLDTQKISAYIDS